MSAVVKKEGGELVTPEMQFMAVIERMASNPDVDVNKLTAILDMQERILNKKAEAEFNEAFARLSGRLPRISKQGEAKNNGKLLYKFARWEDIDAQIRPLLDEEGFALSFNTQPLDGRPGVVVFGTLAHKSGHSRTAQIELPVDNSGAKNSIQGMGSTFSYGKRYTATMLLNITVENEDSDGAARSYGFITHAQKDELVGLMQETGADAARFLQFLGVAVLDDLPASQFARARGALLQKKSKEGAQ